MAIGVGNTSENFGDGNQSWSHTVAAGSNLLIVGIGEQDNFGSVTNVTYNSVAMTLALRHLNATEGEATNIYYLVGPTVGTNTVAYSYPGGERCGSGAIDFSGADAKTPIGATAGSNSSGGGSLTTTFANSYVVDSYVAGVGTISAGYTEYYSTTNVAKYWGQYRAATTVGSYSMTWSGGTNTAQAMAEVIEAQNVYVATQNEVAASSIFGMNEKI